MAVRRFLQHTLPLSRLRIPSATACRLLPRDCAKNWIGSAAAATGSVTALVWRTPARAFQMKTLDDVERAGDVKKAATGTWESRRYYLAKDGCGFSMHHTILYAGSATKIWYKHHYEIVFITKGRGSIEVFEHGQVDGPGKVYELEPGSCYALDENDRHILRAHDDGDMHVVCAFHPALHGDEDHDADGAYLPSKRTSS